MAAEDEKGPEGSSGKPGGSGLTGRKLDRRDVLLGLSTVPALGLFGYAWRKQSQYEQKPKEAASAQTAAAAKNVKEVNVALLGAGAQGQVLLDAMLRIPGLRFRAVCDVWTEYNQKRVVNTLKKFKFDVNGYEDYREMLDKEKDLDAVVIATPDFWHAHAHRRLPEGRQARLLREGDVEHAGGRPAAWCSRPGRPGSSSRSATSGAATRATCTATTSSSARRGSSGGS